MQDFLNRLDSRAHAQKREPRPSISPPAIYAQSAAKVIIAIMVADGLSPIDSIPDFISVLSYFDDLCLLAFGIYLALRLIPATVLADTTRASYASFSCPRSGSQHLAILLLWTISMIVSEYW